MATRTITEDNLGAWLIKCDPESKYDLPRAIEAGRTYVDNWSVSRGYRSSMMRPEHKVILWVSGNGRRMARGIWGTGWVEGYVQDTGPEELEDDEESFWHSEEDRLAVTNDIALFIPLFLDPVTSDEIAAAGITDLEVQLQAQMSNPSWVSKEQLKRLEPMLGEWPEYEEPDQEITITKHGAGFGTPEQNLAVEHSAVAAVIDFYGDEWRAKDVSVDKVGWDITFTHKKTREVAKVEVKGLSGDRHVVLLTANELRAAKDEPDWVLAVVTRALSTPQVTEYTAQQALAAAQPYVFKADLSQV